MLVMNYFFKPIYPFAFGYLLSIMLHISLTSFSIFFQNLNPLMKFYMDIPLICMIYVYLPTVLQLHIPNLKVLLKSIFCIISITNLFYFSNDIFMRLIFVIPMMILLTHILILSITLQDHNKFDFSIDTPLFNSSVTLAHNTSDLHENLNFFKKYWFFTY